MAASVTSVVREILTADRELSADEVIERAKRRGLTASDATVRASVHNVRSQLKKVGGSPSRPTPPAARPAPAAARETPAPVTSNSVAAAPAADVSAVLANVALVNRVVGQAGGVAAARAVAEAVRSCGGVDPFLAHLDLVAGIRPDPPAAG